MLGDRTKAADYKNKFLKCGICFPVQVVGREEVREMNGPPILLKF